MYCLIQFYIQIRERVADHSPFLKILSIKLVIFLSFWQTVRSIPTIPLVKAANIDLDCDIIPYVLRCRKTWSNCRGTRPEGWNTKSAYSYRDGLLLGVAYMGLSVETVHHR